MAAHDAKAPAGPVQPAAPDAVTIDIVVSPRASRTKVAGIHDGRVKVAVAAPPVDGKANEALIRFLARTLGVPRRSVAIAAGSSGRRKRLTVQGLTVSEARRLLGL